MTNLIELNNISAGYGDKEILSNVTINIPQRGFLGVIGPNGGGKTTLLRVILGMLKPTSGRKTFFRADGTPKEHINMGYLPQHTQIDRKFPLSVMEVLRSGLGWSFKDIFSTEKKVYNKRQLDAVIERFHLEDVADCHISELSGGQLQRVLIARALIAKPDVVILDEPNTYIDPHSQSRTYEMLKSVNDECAVIVVGHDIEALLRHAQTIVCLNHTAEQYDANDIKREAIDKCFVC